MGLDNPLRFLDEFHRTLPTKHPFELWKHCSVTPRILKHATQMCVRPLSLNRFDPSPRRERAPGDPWPSGNLLRSHKPVRSNGYAQDLRSPSEYMYLTLLPAS